MWKTRRESISSTKGHCGATLKVTQQFPCPAVRGRCFPADILMTRLCGGRQRQQQAERTHSDQPVITIVSHTAMVEKKDNSASHFLPGVKLYGPNQN
ncbi:hypothetical protein EYF80_007762 [Liparis tanakae]|uniref:Uncharacterized protein n=1 Tax=Liparis tanakae TaxID=230148 RepID=A0A4Z2IW55_9TELE|nr:hypothetical protein EYF80_007762 [Liparis tanakae]